MMPAFIEELREKFSKELPGESAHIAMAPVGRLISSLARKASDVYRDSAVSLILFPKENQIHFYLIQRHVYVGAHSGQVSFPGGKKEENDANLMRTAMRETYEEIGVELTESQFIGELTPVFIPVSKFNMEIFVFWLEKEPNLKIDPYEVESVFSISIDELLNEEKVQEISIPIGDGLILKKVPCFVLNEKVVWGATALVLSELKTMLKG